MHHHAHPNPTLPTLPSPQGAGVPDKKRRLSLIGLTLITLALLASGLNQLILLPGQPFVLQELAERPTLPPTLIMSMIIVGVVGYFAIIILLNPSLLWRNRILLLLTLFGLLFACLFLMWLAARPTVDYSEPIPGLPTLAPDEISLTPDPELEAAPLPEAMPIPTPPRWLAPLISFGLTLLLLLSMGGLAWWWYKKRPPRPDPTRAALAQEAQTALARLDEGADWADVIVRCYAGMAQAVQTQYEVQRAVAMTPQEFAAELAAIGLPAEPVKNLTTLFEATRYGGQQADVRQQAVAKESLAAIVAALEVETDG